MGIFLTLIGIVVVIGIGYIVGAKLGFYKIDSSSEDERRALEAALAYLLNVGDDLKTKAWNTATMTKEELAEFEAAAAELAKTTPEKIAGAIKSGKDAASSFSERTRKYLDL